MECLYSYPESSTNWSSAIYADDETAYELIWYAETSELAIYRGPRWAVGVDPDFSPTRMTLTNEHWECIYRIDMEFDGNWEELDLLAVITAQML